MESKLTLHLKNFNTKVKVMNQTNSPTLVLTKLEALNVQSELFDLLTQIAALTKIKETEEVIQVGMDGGGF